MMNSFDRDTVMQIKFENIHDTQRSNFIKVDPRKYSNFGTDFDFDSVMMYPVNAFSKNRQDTMIPHDPNNKKRMGQRDRLSPGGD
jgi:Astacin (Peptidase family M12A)